MEAPRRGRLFLKLSAAAVLLVVGYVGITFLQVWQASRADDARPSEAIIVLGAAQYDGRPSPVLRDRLDHAHRLWDEGLAPTIVVTGGNQPGDRFTEATASYNYLRELGVPDEALLKEVNGANTWEQLAASARFLRDREVRRVVLVTDDYHSFRVEAIADGLGLDAAVSPADSRQSVTSKLKSLTKETLAVSVGRFLGYRRLVDLDDKVTSAPSIGTEPGVRSGDGPR